MHQNDIIPIEIAGTACRSIASRNIRGYVEGQYRQNDA